MKTAIVAALVLLVGLVVVWNAKAYEEPAYEIVEKTDDYEVRRYLPYLVAETVVEGDFRDAGNTAFRRLFGYISGKNRQANEIAMTVPVTSQPASAASGKKIAMTVPVISADATEQQNDTESFLYQFIMPSQYTLDSLPKPEDSRVTLRQIPEHYLAVRSYSGRSHEAGYQRHKKSLLEALQADDVAIIGDPVFARYNGPLTPWFMRRNEVMVEIQPARSIR